MDKINLDPKVFEEAAEKVDFWNRPCCCSLRGEYQGELEEYFKPKDKSMGDYWWKHPSNKCPQSRLQRSIALLLLAEIAREENENKRR